MMHVRAPDVLVIPVLLTVILLAAEMMRAPQGGGWLAGPRWVWLGEISYAIYMIHALVMMLVLYGSFLVLGPKVYDIIWPLLVLVFLGLTLALSGGLFEGVERPMRRWITTRYKALEQGRKVA